MENNLKKIYLYYPILFAEGTLGQPNFFYNEQLMSIHCCECDKHLSKGNKYFFDVDDHNEDLPKFDEEHWICESCMNIHKKGNGKGMPAPLEASETA